ncbi:MAG TPA: 4Fe-4S binding protein, partial [Synergistaceae bacterium]|nr:4Fe-4S binding protein [Synergistaceae bacterium]
KNGVVRLDNKKCTSCLMCVGFCPTASMFFDADAQPQPFKCIACGLCATVCPTGALELQNS